MTCESFSKSDLILISHALSRLAWSYDDRSSIKNETGINTDYKKKYATRANITRQLIYKVKETERMIAYDED